MGKIELIALLGKKFRRRKKSIPLIRHLRTEIFSEKDVLIDLFSFFSDVKKAPEISLNG